MLPKKLIALTHCIRASLMEGRWEEAGQLLFERQSVIEEIAELHVPLTELEKKSILEADEAVKAAVKERRGTLLQRLRGAGTTKKLRNTYKLG